MKKEKSKEELDFLSKNNRKSVKIDLFLLEKVKLPITINGNKVTSIERYKDDGLKLIIDNAEELIIINPPLKVPDGTTYEEIDTLTGEIITMDNMVFNPLKALKEIVKQYIKSKK